MGTSLHEKTGQERTWNRQTIDPCNRQTTKAFFTVLGEFEAQDGLKWNSIFAFVAMGDCLRKGR